MATLYTARFNAPEALEQGADNALSCPVYRNAALVAPTSGTLTVWNASNVKVVDAQAVTVAANIATYTIASATLASQLYSDGWRFEWTLVIATVTNVFRNDGSLVYRRLYPVITDLDFTEVHTDFEARKSVATFQPYIDKAWGEIQRKLINTGKRPWLIMSPSALYDAHFNRTLALVFKDWATGGSASAEWEMMLHYEDLFGKSWGELTFPVITVEGESTGERRRSTQSVIFLTSRN
jgi:hypothetical protein